MKISKAVITAAGRGQRRLPLQTLIDRDGKQKAVLAVLVEEVVRAGIDDVCIVVHPGDEVPYMDVVGDRGAGIRFIPQHEPLGYGHAISCAKEFVGSDAFLHLVGDHLWVSGNEKGCVRQIVELAEGEGCVVSAVQATRESLLPQFGVVGGKRVHGRSNVFRVETVIEKPTPTEAEQRLLVSGLRAGYYLCFFGIHVLNSAVLGILDEKIRLAKGLQRVTLSDALAELAVREQYLALQMNDLRYDLGSKYGLLNAQLAVALSGVDRDDVMSVLLELFAQREIAGGGRTGQ
jgi:UTP--glucose-1-phosphate uridylyltransferase